MYVMKAVSVINESVLTEVNVKNSREVRNRIGGAQYRPICRSCSLLVIKDKRPKIAIIKVMKKRITETLPISISVTTESEIAEISIMNKRTD